MKKFLILSVCSILANSSLIMGASEKQIPSYLRDTERTKQHRGSSLQLIDQIGRAKSKDLGNKRPKSSNSAPQKKSKDSLAFIKAKRSQDQAYARSNSLPSQTFWSNVQQPCSYQVISQSSPDESLRLSQQQAVLAAIRQINIQFSPRKPELKLKHQAYEIETPLTTCQENSVQNAILEINRSSMPFLKFSDVEPTQSPIYLAQKQKRLNQQQFLLQNNDKAHTTCLKFSDSQPTPAPSHVAQQQKDAIFNKSNNPLLNIEVSCDHSEKKSPTRVTFSPEAPIIIKKSTSDVLHGKSCFIPAATPVNKIFAQRKKR
jgi:hypothetical protein